MFKKTPCAAVTDKRLNCEGNLTCCRAYRQGNQLDPANERHLTERLIREKTPGVVLQNLETARKAETINLPACFSLKSCERKGKRAFFRPPSICTPKVGRDWTV